MQDPAAPDLDLKYRGNRREERNRGSSGRGQKELLLGLLTICIEYQKS